MQEWKRIEPTKTTKVGWRTIVTKTFIMPDGQTTEFDLLHPDGQEFVDVIALTPEKKAVTVRLFRAGPEKVMTEFPGGFVDKGESLEAAALRELKEETGYEAGSIRYLGKYHKDTYMNAVWHSFIAYECVPKGGQKLDAEEQLEVQLLSIDEVIENARNDGTTDHATLFMAYDELMQQKAQAKG